MLAPEFKNTFDLYYNNSTSNQAPGLNDWEISVFLTNAQEEILKNYFNPKGNKYQEGFDDSSKRQMDFSKLMRIAILEPKSTFIYTPQEGAVTIYNLLDPRSTLYTYPQDVFQVLNESLLLQRQYSSPHSSPEVVGIRQIKPLSYTEYSKLMSQPYKNPLKNQAWRLLSNAMDALPDDEDYGKIGIELIPNSHDRQWLKNEEEGYTHEMVYEIRYIRKPLPIIISDLSEYGMGLLVGGYDGSPTGINGNSFYTDGKCCELDESLHKEIVQRAVELAKASWQGDMATSTQMGQRVE